MADPQPQSAQGGPRHASHGSVTDERLRWAAPRSAAVVSPPTPSRDVSTHAVLNQPPPLTGFDALACDPALTDAVAREGAGDALPALAHLGALVTSAEGREHARLADANPPVLRSHDRYGRRIDEVEFHP